MGLGIHKWKYSKQSRRLFSVPQKDPVTKAQNYDWEFKLGYWKNASDILIRITLFIVLVTVSIRVCNRWMRYEKQLVQYELKHQELRDNRGFKFLVNSGKYRLDTGNYRGALSEFKLAMAIFPDDKEVKELYNQTIMALCYNCNTNCDEFVN
ncbi:MAG: hypothetical protein ED556_07560 [Winogradskyella sp.]|uniref:hypothetical protein n=1 Tax=Winogradskyella sp. TaxID=1883156 RepID=UPI000F3E0E07|nr:hypothetical protein [Winogradskyella sp.]RNC87267.1 MAG: hypothetical protein ED556_07560 [Winogradskyella sp.]